MDEEQDVVVNEDETKARESGWLPKAEWKGNPDHWKPAEAWLEQAPKNYIPKLEKRIGQLEGQLAKRESEFADRIKRLEGTTKAALSAQRERLEDEFETRKEKAVETGDTEAYKRAVTDQKKAVEGLDKKIEAAEDKQAKTDVKAGDLPADVQEELLAWQKENEWFGTDRRLRRFAIGLYDEVEEDMPSVSVKTKLAEVLKRMKEEFPAKFKDEDDEEEPEPKRSRVEGGSRNAGSNGAKKQTWQAIPSADRAMAAQVLEAFLKKGETLEANLAQVHDRYAAEYWKDQAA